MGRPPRITQPGLAYHVLNRRVMRLPLFLKDNDYLAFERVLAESLARPDTPRLLAWCLMPNHWHLVVHARRQTDLSAWMRRNGDEYIYLHFARAIAFALVCPKRAEQWHRFLRADWRAPSASVLPSPPLRFGTRPNLLP